MQANTYFFGVGAPQWCEYGQNLVTDNAVARTHQKTERAEKRGNQSRLPKFLSTDHLKKWLKASPVGREIIEEVLAEADLPEKRRVLAVVHHDRVELYGYYLNIKEVQAIHGKTPNMERYAELLVERELPKNFLDLFWPAVAKLDQPGHIATLTPRKMSLQEHEWWQAYKQNNAALAELIEKKTNQPAKT